MATSRKQLFAQGFLCLALFSTLIVVGILRQGIHASTIASDLWYTLLPNDTQLVASGDEAFRFAEGDPVVALIDGQWKLVGSMMNTHNESSSPIGPRSYRVRWRSTEHWPAAEPSWEAYETPDSLVWAAQVLLPEKKRKELTKALMERLRENRSSLTDSLEPLLVQSVRDLMPLFEDRIKQSVQNQQPELQKLADRYREELIHDQLIPLVKSEILPLVERRTKPLMSEVGKELFERASVWRFTWRYLYDASPLPQRDLVQREFDRFVREDGIPVLESHMDEILKAMKDVAVEIGRNPEVRRVGKEATAKMFHDPAIRELMAKTLRDVFHDPQPLRDALRKNWEGASGQSFAEAVNQTVDPWLRNAGAEILGTEDGLTQELVSVLRSQILSKDRRWVVVRVQPRNSRVSRQPWKLVAGKEFPRYPLLVEVKDPILP